MWKSGTYAGSHRLHRWIKIWAVENLGGTCAVCDATDTNLHHIIAKKYFPHIVMSHFRQNLVLLCAEHHYGAEKTARAAIRMKQPQCAPFASSLPESILAQLVQDGLVSQLPLECDFSPLGNVSEQVLHPEFFFDKAEKPVANVLGE